MEDRTGYYQDQSRQSPLTAPFPAGQHNKVGRDTPQFQARKAMFNKFPDEWKRKITAEQDVDRRLQLFESYAQQIRISEDQRNREMMLQRLGQQTPSLAASLQRPLASNLSRPLEINNNSARVLSHGSTPSQVAISNGAVPLRPGQARILRPVASANGLKRPYSPHETTMQQNLPPRTNIKRIKQEDSPPHLSATAQSPNAAITTAVIKGTGGAVYIQQKMPDGQVRLIPATVVEQTVGNGRPLYVQTNTAPQASVQTGNVIRRQIVYRADQGVRKVANGFSSSPQQSSPASSSSSIEPDAMGRVVPDSADYRHVDSTRVRRLLTPHGPVEERIATPSPEAKPEPVVKYGFTPQLSANRFADNCAARQSPTPSPEMQNGVNRSSPVELRPLQVSPPGAEEAAPVPQQPAANPMMAAAAALLQELRRDPDYRALVLKLRNKYGEDLKRILERSKLDNVDVPKRIMEVLSILNLKVPVGRDKWDLLESKIQEVIEHNGICYPLFAELRRSSDALDSTQPGRSPMSEISFCDPWKACRDRFVRVPQFILDAANA